MKETNRQNRLIFLTCVALFIWFFSLVGALAPFSRGITDALCGAFFIYLATVIPSLMFLALASFGENGGMK